MWFPRKTGTKPKRCPKRECRKGAGYGSREAERVIRAKGVQGMRSGVQDKDGGRATGKSTSTIRRSSDNAPTDTGAMEDGIREDSVIERTKRWLGPPHAEDCGCKVCKEKKRKHGD